MTATDEIYEALLALAHGPGVTIHAVLEHPALMRLRYVVTEAQSGPGLTPTPRQVASTCVECVRAAASAIGPPSEDVLPNAADMAGAALAQLGLAPGTAGLLPYRRRQIAASRMDMQVD